MKEVYPLNGKTILVTRPGISGEELAAKLESAGAKAIVMPMIEITDPDSWQVLDDAIKNIDSYNWLFFASSNAVIAFCKRWVDKKKLPRIAVIGEATGAVAKEKGLNVDYCPDTYIAENFIEQFPGYPKLLETRILWPRTNIGRDLIAQKLQACGAVVHEVPAYKAVLPANAKDLSKQLNQLIAEKKIDAITLASKETAKNLSQVINSNLPTDFADEQIAVRLKEILFIAIGPQTAEGILNYLGKESIQANPYTNEGIVAALIEYYGR